jgi:IS5 family transposase
MGRRRIDRTSIARAFVAKAVYGLPTTELLIELLHAQPTLRKICGFETRRQIPSPATFSRAFAEFAKTDLGDRVLAALVSEHVGTRIVMHESIDSTEIDAREKVKFKPKIDKAPTPRRKPGPPKKGEERPPKEPTGISRQLRQSAQEALAELSRECDWSTKKNSQGKNHSWKGYKSHISWADDNVPLKAVTTSASVSDCMVAVPLMRMVAEKVTVIYDLMDAAYDAADIAKASRELGHVPIIDPNPSHKRGPQDPAQLERYKERTTAERGNSRLKDQFGGRHVRVRGNAKVHMHVMWGLIVLFADQILKPIVS